MDEPFSHVWLLPLLAPQRNGSAGPANCVTGFANRAHIASRERPADVAGHSTGAVLRVVAATRLGSGWKMAFPWAESWPDV